MIAGWHVLPLFSFFPIHLFKNEEGGDKFQIICIPKLLKLCVNGSGEERKSNDCCMSRSWKTGKVRIPANWQANSLTAQQNYSDSEARTSFALVSYTPARDMGNSFPKPANTDIRKISLNLCKTLM